MCAEQNNRMVGMGAVCIFVANIRSGISFEEATRVSFVNGAQQESRHTVRSRNIQFGYGGNLKTKAGRNGVTKILTR